MTPTTKERRASDNDSTSADADNEGGVVLLNDTDIDPEVATRAAAAVKRTAAKWVRRHDIDYENGRL